MSSKADQWISQGYAIRQKKNSVTLDKTGTIRDQATLDAHRFFDHCKQQNIPQITAVYTAGSKYAMVEVDFFTTKNHVLGKAGQQELSALLEPHMGRSNTRGTMGGRYSYIRYIPRERLDELMPQVVEIVRNHTETDPNYGRTDDH